MRYVDFYGWQQSLTKLQIKSAEYLSRAGTVWINCYDNLNAQAPFGGYKVQYQSCAR